MELKDRTDAVGVLLSFLHNTPKPRVEAESKILSFCGYPADLKARRPILFGGLGAELRDSRKVRVAKD